MSFSDEWDEFVESTGFVKAKDLVDHLVIIYPIGYVPHIQTINSIPGKRSDAVACDVIDLDVVGDDGQMGKLYRNNNFMQGKLIGGLRPRIGGRVLGYIAVEATAKAGRNPAYVFMSATQNADAVARANAWMQAHPEYTPTEFIERAQAPAPPVATQPQYPAAQPQYHQPPAVTYGYQGESSGQPQYPQPQYPQAPYSPPVQPQFQAAQPQFQQTAQPQYAQPQHHHQGPPPDFVPPEYRPPQQAQQPLPPATVGARPAGPAESSSVLDRLRAMQGAQPQLTPEQQAAQQAQYGF